MSDSLARDWEAQRCHWDCPSKVAVSRWHAAAGGGWVRVPRWQWDRAGRGTGMGRGQRWWLSLSVVCPGGGLHGQGDAAGVLRPCLGPKLCPAQRYFQDEVAIGALSSVGEGTASCSVPLHPSHRHPCCLRADGSPGEGVSAGLAGVQEHPGNGPIPTGRSCRRNRPREPRWHQPHGEGGEVGGDAVSPPLCGCG